MGQTISANDIINPGNGVEARHLECTAKITETVIDRGAIETTSAISLEI